MKQKKKPSKPSTKKKVLFKEKLAEEWDLNEDMGVLPKDVALTQNIGCVGAKNQKK